MGFLGFGKKKKDSIESDLAGLDNSLSSDSGMDFGNYGDPGQQFNNQQASQQFDSFGNPRPQQRFEQAYPQSFQGQPQQASQNDYSKDMQIIIAKLDALRAEIQNISHRLDNLEKQKDQNKRYW